MIKKGVGIFRGLFYKLVGQLFWAANFGVFYFGCFLDGRCFYFLDKSAPLWLT